jgi:putative flippase GtrA
VGRARERPPWRRWWRFNLVGLLGFVLQLSLLSILTRLTTWPLGVCVAIAVMATVSHNFLWHTRYTWRHTDGPGIPCGRRARQWVAFNASNGLISLACNLLVTAVVATAGVPVLAANVAAIVAASLANFVGMLESGTTQAQLLELAATVDVNATNIDLVGLAATGVVYL